MPQTTRPPAPAVALAVAERDAALAEQAALIAAIRLSAAGAAGQGTERDNEGDDEQGHGTDDTDLDLGPVQRATDKASAPLAALDAALRQSPLDADLLARSLRRAILSAGARALRQALDREKAASAGEEQLNLAGPARRH